MYNLLVIPGRRGWWEMTIGAASILDLVFLGFLFI